MPSAGPADCARRAAALAAAGDRAAAEAVFEEGLARFPGDAELANAAGNFHARNGDNPRALALFERALRLDPALAQAAINAAIVLLRLSRPRAAGALLAAHEGRLGSSAQYWTLRAESAKALGELTHAENFLSRAQACEAGGPRVLKARARLSLERGLARAVEDYEAALLQTPGDFDLMLGYAQALEAAGRRGEALAFAEGLAAHFPSWIAGQALLAELRWAAGEAEDYTAHFAGAAAGHPAPEIYLEWASLLAGTDRHGEAAQVLEKALRLWPDDTRLRLQRAIELGEAGEAEAADAILVIGGEEAGEEWLLARARNDLRLGRVEKAATGLEALARADGGNVAAWSLLDLCWRLAGDERHHWLHGQPGLVREIELPLEPARLEALRAVLRGLHAGSAMPLAQSVKGGTQTRGALFARPEPELAELKIALGRTIESYRAQLPPADAAHPLLARRADRWMIAGSWSVRFTGSGRHAAHIHPLGLLSSACYIVVPDAVEREGGPGWLELGRPPEGIAPELGPLAEIKPREGMCALFPSTLFHGTRAIDAGERMTVAFDVAPEPG